jgi:hypothetical protein
MSNETGSFLEWQVGEVRVGGADVDCSGVLFFVKVFGFKKVTKPLVRTAHVLDSWRG